MESTRGRYGGYRVGRGLRLPPLMFTPTEAFGLVMAVLEGHPAGEDDPVGQALGKIVRALPEPLAGPPTPYAGCRLAAGTSCTRRGGDRYGSCRPRTRGSGCGCGTATTPAASADIELDPWAVVVRHRRWYLLGWSHDKDARRVLRVDRVKGVEVLARTVRAAGRPGRARGRRGAALDGLEARRRGASSTLRSTQCRHWLPRSFGRLEEVDEHATRLVATTDEPEWYAAQLAHLPMSFRLVGSPEVRAAMDELGRRLLAAAEE